jgi:hypothetical protein
MGLSVEIVRRPPKPVPEKVARTWAEEWAKEGRKVDWQKLMPPRGFVALVHRWVVERTFSWSGQNRLVGTRTMSSWLPRARRSSTWR